MLVFQLLERVASAVADHDQPSIARQVARAVRPEAALPRRTAAALLFCLTSGSVGTNMQDLIHQANRLPRLRIDHQTVLTDVAPTPTFAVADLSQVLE